MKLEDIRCGNAVIVRPLEARLDAAAAPHFKASVVTMIQAGEQTILLDLSEVDFIDSSGLGALVSLLKRMSPAGTLAVCGLRSAALNMFRLTRMDKVFPIFSSRAEALTALAS
ncbi:MAG TPA: STAS domain-containing protein [Gammaproteobacteria bacterium]